MQKVPQKDNKTEILALVLIAIGFLWLLRKTGVFYHFPFFHFDGLFAPIRHAFHGIEHAFFSWPMVLILVGLVLMAGRRSAGLVLLIIGAIFIIPKFFLSGAFVFAFFPLIIIGLGIALIVRKL
jgi:hypothetical protein